MKQFLFFIFLLTAFSLTQTVVASDNVLGILVEIKTKKVLESKKLKKLLRKNNLKEGRYYSILKVQSYEFQNTDKNQNDFKLLCNKIVKEFPEILSCELNKKIKGQTKSNMFNTEVFFPPRNNQQMTSDCDLLSIERMQEEYYYEAKLEGLSPLWAQEYVGSDLLKEEMSKREVDVSNTSNLLGVWDSDFLRHGEQAANLIMGPFESALIPSDRQKAHIDNKAIEDYLLSYELNHRKCRESGSCPRFINNSMYWNNSDQKRKIVKRLSKEGTVFVTAANNDNKLVSDAKRKSSKDEDSILVASHAPSGLSSDFTSYAPEVDISAPSDHYILSFNKDGSANTFGGTSGATPLVTSTLLAFELIAGGKLSTAQFKDLLYKTAITHAKDPARKFTGKGYLNTYKIGAVAFRLKELCKNKVSEDEKNKCIQDKLKDPNTYDFAQEIKEDEVIKNAESAFPECASKSTQKTQNYTCMQKESALKELRKASFLNPKNLKYWEKLACIHKEMKLDINAQYYSRLAKGKRFESIPSDLRKLGNADLIELLQYNWGESEYRKLALELINWRTTSFKYVKDDLRKNREFLFEVLKQRGAALKFVDEELRKDREIVLKAVKEYGYSLQYAHKDLKNDRDFILEAVKRNGSALEYAHEDIRKDKDFVIEAIKNNGLALKHAHEYLTKDKGFVLEIVMKDGGLLQFVHEDFKNNKEIVFEAVKKNGYALMVAHQDLKNDKEIVLEAIKTDGSIIKYAHEDLKEDRGFILKAIKHNANTLKYIHEDFKNNRDFILEAIKQNKHTLEYASKDFKKDREIVLEAVKQYGDALQYAHKDFKNDIEIILEAVIQDEYALAYADDNIRKDKNVILEAIMRNRNALKFAHQDLKKDEIFLYEAVKENPHVFEDVHEVLRKNRDFVLEAVKENGHVLLYVDDYFKKDKEIVLEAVKQDGYALEYAHDNLKQDKEIVLEAIKQNVYAIRYAHETLKDDREIVDEVTKQK